MAHTFGFPAGQGYTATVTLDPSLVTIQEERIMPAQRFRETADGTHWVFQLSGNRLQTFEVLVEWLHEINNGTLSGYLTLKQFFEAPVNWMGAVFDLVHDDGGTTVVRLVLEQNGWEFTEVQKGRWSGRFLLRKSFANPLQTSLPSSTFSM